VSTAQIRLRRLTVEDAALYRELRLEALTNSPDAFSSTIDIERDRPLDRFAARLTENFVLGAFDGERPVGIAGFYVQPGPKHAHKGMLWGMYVRPETRGAGIGRVLLEAIIAHARDQRAIKSKFCSCSLSPTICRHGGSTKASGSSNTASSETPPSIAAATTTTC
jgi:GNAT superfamily N-acetyltransferase